VADLLQFKGIQLNTQIFKENSKKIVLLYQFYPLYSSYLKFECPRFEV
jgi:hypothetical protein